MDKASEIKKIKAAMATLQGQLEELDPSEAKPQSISDGWNDSGCVIDEDWEQSARHWDDDWYSSSTDC